MTLLTYCCYFLSLFFSEALWAACFNVKGAELIKVSFSLKSVTFKSIRQEAERDLNPAGGQVLAVVVVLV